MTDNKPKFRLENIALLPVGISNVIKEIMAEISFNNQLQPVLVHNGVCIPYIGPCATQTGEGLSHYTCDPFCSCNTECECDNHCNYCKCVDNCRCNDHCECENYEGTACPDYGCSCFMN